MAIKQRPLRRKSPVVDSRRALADAEQCGYLTTSAADQSLHLEYRRRCRERGIPFVWLRLGEAKASIHLELPGHWTMALEIRRQIEALTDNTLEAHAGAVGAVYGRSASIQGALVAHARRLVSDLVQIAETANPEYRL